MPARVRRWIIAAIILLVVVPVGALGTVLAAFLFFPLPTALPEPRPNPISRISHIYDAKGREIGLFREFETDIPVKRADVPPHLKEAVVAAEDRRFYEHTGVDFQASMRALWADVRGRRYAQGGSTITQQYVKNTYTGRERSLSRKFREAILARQLDRDAPKEEILYRYLSSIYLGGGAYGVGAASQSYFRKPVQRLTLSEAALLAGVIPAPTHFDPRSNPVGADNRRVNVLDRMLEQGRITPDQHAKAVLERVTLLRGNERPPAPATAIHPPEEQQTAFPYFVDYLRRYLITKYGPEKVFRGGLRIQTTLDPELQAKADAAVRKALDGTRAPLEMSLVTVEPPTGYVKAVVGGRDFTQSQVNLALGNCQPNDEQPDESGPVCMDGGGTGRQPGSSFKPFTLAKAFEEGMPPTKGYSAPSSYRVPGCTGKQCVIKNVEGQGFGGANLRSATWRSVNTVYAQLVRDVGVKETAELAHRLGLPMVSPNGRDAQGPYGVSLTLGTEETSPLDMAAAFGVFAARGMQAPATPVAKILEPNGGVLEDNTRRQPKRVLSEVVADNVTDVLRGVVEQGTGKSADIKRPAAGKTGTSENFGDAWFVGYTPTLSTSVWLGYADAPRPMQNIKGVGRVYGGTIPAATWKDFMAAALKDVPVTEFNQAAPIEPIADELRRLARGGFDPGERQEPVETPTGGPYVVDAPPAPAPSIPPPTTTTTTFAVPPTTTTTRRGLFP